MPALDVKEILDNPAPPQSGFDSCSGVGLLQHGTTTFCYEEFMETLTKSEKHALKDNSESMAL